MTDLVSILMPAFNAERWIAQAIRSALEQTWPRTELVIVDDGSSDRTLDICRSFESRRVKVIAQPNRGAPAARNRALDAAQGSFIQWLDADDVLHPDKIARQMTAAHMLSDPRRLLSGPHGSFYYRLERAVFARTSLWRDSTPIEYFLARFLDNVWIQTGGWLVSRELTDAAGPWTDSPSPNDDGEYFCRVVMKSAGVKFVEEARTYYRIGNYDSLAHASSEAARESQFHSMDVSIKYLLAMEDSPRTRAAAIQLLQSYYPTFYLETRLGMTERLQHLAKELGGELHIPALKWKYRPVEFLCGYRTAMRLSQVLPSLKGRAKREWDRYLRRLLISGERIRGRAESATPLPCSTLPTERRRARIDPPVAGGL
jgi:glycosyltransferase involved in cell wall biosynthesis